VKGEKNPLKNKNKMDRIIEEKKTEKIMENT
jgi:hypothetical protein